MDADLGTLRAVRAVSVGEDQLQPCIFQDIFVLVGPKAKISRSPMPTLTASSAFYAVQGPRSETQICDGVAQELTVSYLDDAGLLMDTASRQAAPCQHSMSCVSFAELGKVSQDEGRMFAGRRGLDRSWPSGTSSGYGRVWSPSREEAPGV